jgi:small basic protein
MANKCLGITMKELIEKIHEDPQALSDYFGRRLIAASIVILGVSLGALSF